MQHSFTMFSNIQRVRSLACAGLALFATVLAGCHDDDRLQAPSIQPQDIPNSVVIADFDNDGRNDLAVAYTHEDNSFPNVGYVSTIIQSHTSAGTFMKGVDTAIGSNPSILAAGDLDEANGIDLVSANYYSNNVSVLLQGTTAGQFSSASNITLSSATVTNPNGVAVGDLNGDGLADIAVADQSTGNNIYVLLQDAANHGHFLAPVTLTNPNPVSSVAIADVDVDGLADIVSTSYSQHGDIGNASVFIQDPAHHGAFLTRVDYDAGLVPSAIKVADVDGDGRPDLTVADRGFSQAGHSGVSVLIQSTTTAGTFLAPVTYSTAYGAIDVAVGDLNNDGKPDLVVANLGGSWTGSVSVLLQDPTHPGMFTAPTSYPGLFGPLGVAIGDLNGDGKPDIAVADGNRATIMFQNATPGSFNNPVAVGE